METNITAHLSRRKNMPKIRIEKNDIELEARPYSLTLYSREFGDDKDLVEDAMVLIEGFQKGKIKANIFMRIVWCFAKTHKLMNNVSILPSYEEWMMGFESMNLGNQENMTELAELINDRLFREEKERKEETK